MAVTATDARNRLRPRRQRGVFPAAFLERETGKLQPSHPTFRARFELGNLGFSQREPHALAQKARAFAMQKAQIWGTQFQ